MELKQCKKCGQNFEVTNEDLKFYDKVSPEFNGKKFLIPPPTLCPDCRRQRRFSYRNERSLYKRKCSKTGEEIISMYRQDAKFPVYSPKEWFSDNWDAKEFGRDFDFNRSFFEQFKSLRDEVPHLSLISSNNVNSVYCNVVGNSKNCYLIFGSIDCEDCYYGNPFKCHKCIDSLLVRNSEFCSECTDCNHLYNCYFCQNCNNSHNLKFCFAVDNSEDCFGCAALNHKKYCVFNEQFTKEQYEEFIAKPDLRDPKIFAEINEEFIEIKKGAPHRFYTGTQNENVSGDNIFHSQNASQAYNIEDCQDVKDCYQLLGVKDSGSTDYGEYGELTYEVMGFYNNVNHNLFCYWCWDNVSNLLYSGNCNQGTKDCFGCVGLKRAQYCILNKQYTKEEYFELVGKIIEHMRNSGEWGQFFPIALSPFYYNETVAQEHSLLDQVEAAKNGWGWAAENVIQRTSSSNRSYVKTPIHEAIHTAEYSDEITKKVLYCEVTGKSYKIIPQEWQFYKERNLPIPRKCPDQRHLERLALRNPKKLWDRNCMRCGAAIKTTYAPNKIIVYCEKCYREVVY